VPFDDDAEADNPGSSPPPHPDDRLWRHPSEMRAHPIAPVDEGARRLGPPHVTTLGGRPPRRWLVPVVAGAVVGAALAGGAFAVFGLGERVVDRPVTERVALGPTADMVGEPGPGASERDDPTVVAVSGGDAQGSGVVVRDDGIVVTSAALVPEGAAPVVIDADGERPAAGIVGVDAATGLAVLDLAGDGYTPSVMADPAAVELAGAATVLGAVAGVSTSDESTGGDSGGPADDADSIELSRAAGEIGAPRRFVGPDGAALDGIEVVGDADRQGLGGPVLDDGGAVVGVTTAVDDGVAWYVAPIGVARRVIDDLLDDGDVRHCWLGIEGTDAAGDGTGVLVASVVPGSPAADDGLRAGNRIVALDGEEVADMAALLVALRTRAPGDSVDLTTVRGDGSRVMLGLDLTASPETSR
jgi:S1-C subfamily serine protease